MKWRRQNLDNNEIPSSELKIKITSFVVWRETFFYFTLAIEIAARVNGKTWKFNYEKCFFSSWLPLVPSLLFNKIWNVSWSLSWLFFLFLLCNANAVSTFELFFCSFLCSLSFVFPCYSGFFCYNFFWVFHFFLFAVKITEFFISMRLKENNFVVDFKIR